MRKFRVKVHTVSGYISFTVHGLNALDAEETFRANHSEFSDSLVTITEIFD